jgi:hypothetical protein
MVLQLVMAVALIACSVLLFLAAKKLKKSK